MGGLLESSAAFGGLMTISKGVRCVVDLGRVTQAGSLCYEGMGRSGVTIR